MTPESTRTPGPDGSRYDVMRPGAGRKPADGVLGVDAAFDRVPAQDDVLLPQRQRLARRHEQLLAHEIDAGHELGDGVLDLDARVHLHEVVRAVLREQALDRPGGAVARSPRGVDRDLPDPRSQLRRDGGRRRLLDELLVATLDRAVALAEVDDVAVRVGEHLHLDVPRVLEVPLDVDRRVGEVRLPLAPGRRERRLRLVGRGDHLHPLAAAAGRRLHEQRVAELLPERDDLLCRVDRIGRAGDDRHACRLHAGARGGLVSHQLDRLGRRADPDGARLLDRAGERGVLGQEAISRMDGLGARPADGLDQLLDVEVALGRRAPAERVRLVRPGHVQRRPVGVGVHRDRPHAELAQSPEDADCDLPSIGDHDLGEHATYSPRRMSVQAEVVR